MAEGAAREDPLQDQRRSPVAYWCAAGMVEAGKQFRRVNGHLRLRALRTALERHVRPADVGPTNYDHTVSAA